MIKFNEQELFNDPSWTELNILTQNQVLSFGMVTMAWWLAGKYWLKHQAIPAEHWPNQLDPLIQVGIAERKEDGAVLMKGSADMFKNLTQRANAGKSFKNRKRNETKRKRVETKHKRVETKIAIIPEITHLAITDSWKVSLPNDLLRVWSETYPEEFLRGEVKKIRAWLLVNQHKAPKTRWGQFFNSWFIRAWEMQRKILNSNKVQAGKLSIEDIERMWDDDK